MSDIELLYEKIVELSEKKNELIEENSNLKLELSNYHETLFEDFCEFVNIIVNKIDFEKEEINEGLFTGKSDEEKMAKYFVKLINDKAKEIGLNPKTIANLILDKLK